MNHSIITRIKYKSDGTPTLFYKTKLFLQEKYFNGKLNFFLFRKHFSGKRNILLYCFASQFEEHIIDFFNATKNLPNINFILLTGGYDDSKMLLFAKENRIKVFRNFSSFSDSYTDLFVTAASYNKSYFKSNKIPIIYVNHGFHIVGRNNGKDTYAYTNIAKSFRFNAIFEPNIRIAEYIKANEPSIADIVYHVGWKYSEFEQIEFQRKEYWKNALSLNNGKINVFIVSTWGEHSLFHTLGDSFFTQLQKLEAEGIYHFILSTHPMEYKHSSVTPNPIGYKVDEQKKYGMNIRPIGSPWIPYIASADIIISDYSSLTEAAISSGKPLILSEFPDETVWEQSVIAKVKTFLPILKSTEDLEKALSSVQSDAILNKLKCLSKETFVSREQYERRIQDIVISIINE